MAKVKNPIDDLQVNALLVKVNEWIRNCFLRSETRERARDYLKSLLSSIERKNSWQISSLLGELSPSGIQHFLDRAVWNADVIRNRLYSLSQQLRQFQSPRFFVVDEWTFKKKGHQSCGVASQFCHRTGRMENGQIGIFLGEVVGGQAFLLDRELYLPEEWTTDRARRQAVGIPAKVTYQTKVDLAVQMIDRAQKAGIFANWIITNEEFGVDVFFHTAMQERKLHTAFEVNSEFVFEIANKPWRVEEYRKYLPTKKWTRSSFHTRFRIPHEFEWYQLFIQPNHAHLPHNQLLICRSVDSPNDFQYFVCNGPKDSKFKDLIEVVESHFHMKRLIEFGNRFCGLSDYEVRSWKGWHRHISFSLLALLVFMQHPDPFIRKTSLEKIT